MPAGLSGELEWSGIIPAHEERHHFKRTLGREVENYSRYDQIGECSGWLKVGETSIDLDSWWACRDHSWGVREMVGIPEPRTGSPPSTAGGAAFGFLFFSTTTHAGHVQFHHRADGDRHLTAQLIERSSLSAVAGRHIEVEASIRRRRTAATCPAGDIRGRHRRWASRPFRGRGAGPSSRHARAGLRRIRRWARTGRVAWCVAPGIRCLGCCARRRGRAR